MSEIFSLLQLARQDPDICLDYGDAIQVGHVCGGRYQKKPSRFELTYSPEGERENGWWRLDIDRYTIEDIADGRQTQISLYCCETPGCGAMFNKADGYCDCDYIRDPDFGRFDFPEAEEKLRQRGIDGIGAGADRDAVIAMLGPPTLTGGDCDSRFGYIGPWIRYQRDDCQVGFQFGRDGKLQEFSIMDRDWKRGK
jgi:hypothetical protein